MKKSLKKLLAATMLVLMCMSIMPVFAFADGEGVTAEIPVNMNRTGGIPDSAVYTTTLESVESGNPMPESATLTFTDNAHEVSYGDKADYVISYTVPGKYHYTVTQTVTNPLNYMTYDTDVYDVTVDVYYNTDNMLDRNVIITNQSDPDDTKQEAASFLNAYDPEHGIKSLTVEKMWNDGNYSGRPTSVVVELYQNGESVASAVLSKENDWKCTWSGLNYDGTNTYEVKETSKHSRYLVRYYYNFAEDKNIVTCTVVNIYNGGGLIQTGQLNWPIYALAGLGIVAIAIGVFTTKRKKDNNA